MLTHMAQELSSFFISKDIIKEEEREIYDYCFEIFLATIINFFSIIILAFISKTVLPTICFIAGFMVIRATAGGFHAKTHIRCFFLLISLYISYLILVLIIQNYILSISTVILCIISCILVAVFSPVEDYNKPFSKDEYRQFKIVSNIAVFILSFIAIVLVFALKSEKCGFSIAAGMCVVSLSLIAGSIKNRLKKKTDGKECNQ